MAYQHIILNLLFHLPQTFHLVLKLEMVDGLV